MGTKRMMVALLLAAAMMTDSGCGGGCAAGAAGSGLGTGLVGSVLGAGSQLASTAGSALAPGSGEPLSPPAASGGTGLLGGSLFGAGRGESSPLFGGGGGSICTGST